MVDPKPDKFDDIIRRLDVIAIFLLAQKGIGQKDIAKILGGGDNNRIHNIFGKNYTKIQPTNIHNNKEKNSTKKIKKRDNN